MFFYSKGRKGRLNSCEGKIDFSMADFLLALGPWAKGPTTLRPEFG